MFIYLTLLGFHRYGALEESFAEFHGSTIEKYLSDESVTFSVPALEGVTFTLKWEGGRVYGGGHYVLLVDEINFTELP